MENRKMFVGNHGKHGQYVKIYEKKVTNEIPEIYVCHIQRSGKFVTSAF